MRIPIIALSLIVLAACSSHPRVRLPLPDVSSASITKAQSPTSHAGNDMLIFQLEAFSGTPGDFCWMNHPVRPIDDDLLILIQATDTQKVLVTYEPESENYAGKVVRVPWTVIPPAPGAYWIIVYVNNREATGHARYTAWLPKDACAYMDNAFKCNTTGQDFGLGYLYTGCHMYGIGWYETNRILVYRQ